jgi:alkylhydroperoxidase/carboxymuconolactone decarboxylase family protein YurZ
MVTMQRKTRAMAMLNQNPPAEVTNKKLGDDAKSMLVAETDNFKALVLLQAQSLAHSDGDELVLKSHIRRALENYRKGKNREKAGEQLALFMLGAFFSTALQGFVTTLQADQVDKTWIAVYAIIGLVTAIATVDIHRRQR